jgi:hypothetical protein
MEEQEEFGAFIAGFVSGEGSFYISFAKQTGLLPQVSCAFSLKLRADDRELLRSIWAALGYPGNMYRISTRRYQYAWDSVQRHDSVLLKVTSINEHMTRIIPFFEHHTLRGMKRQNYELWQKAVFMLHNGEHLTWDGVSQLRALRAKMNKYQGQDEELPTGPADQTTDTGPATEDK